MEKAAKKLNSLSTTTVIDDLCDELLMEIFVRLPSYETIVKSCKFVSKRWLSLLSHPKFEVDFLNHKKQTKHLRRLPWAFMSTLQMKMLVENYKYNPTHKLFASSKFTLDFLPCYPSFKVDATFKDLVLCRATATNVNQQQYYICNPLTKQWIALPPTPSLPPLDNDDDDQDSWTCLICQDPYYDDIRGRADYIFRVVLVVHRIPNRRQVIRTESPPFQLYNLIVYCSEGSQWREINVKVPLAWPNNGDGLSFFGYLCKGMICVGHRIHHIYSGMFNPFDITLTSAPTLEAILVRLPFVGRVLESGGALQSIYPASAFSLANENKEKDRVQLLMTIQELDPNKRDHNNNQGWSGINISIDSLEKKGGSIISKLSSSRMIGMHPNNKQLLYLLLPIDNVVVLCDIKSKCLKPLGILPPNHLTSSSRLQLQYWPTPLPRI